MSDRIGFSIVLLVIVWISLKFNSDPSIFYPSKYKGWDANIHQGVVVDKNTESYLGFKKRYVTIKENERTYVAAAVKDSIYYSIEKGEKVFFFIRDEENEVVFFTPVREEIDKTLTLIIEEKKLMNNE